MARKGIPITYQIHEIYDSDLIHTIATSRVFRTLTFQITVNAQLVLKILISSVVATKPNLLESGKQYS